MQPVRGTVDTARLSAEILAVQPVRGMGHNMVVQTDAGEDQDRVTELEVRSKEDQVSTDFLAETTAAYHATREVVGDEVDFTKFRFAIMHLKRLAFRLEDSECRHRPVFFEVDEDMCIQLCRFISRKDGVNYDWLHRAMQVGSVKEDCAVYAAILPQRGPEHCKQKQCIMIFTGSKKASGPTAGVRDPHAYPKQKFG